MTIWLVIALVGSFALGFVAGALWILWSVWRDVCEGLGDYK